MSQRAGEAGHIFTLLCERKIINPFIINQLCKSFWLAHFLYRALAWRQSTPFRDGRGGGTQVKGVQYVLEQSKNLESV